jgi:hypothetical protein
MVLSYYLAQIYSRELEDFEPGYANGEGAIRLPNSLGSKGIRRGGPVRVSRSSLSRRPCVRSTKLHSQEWLCYSISTPHSSRFTGRGSRTTFDLTLSAASGFLLLLLALLAQDGFAR